MEAGSPDGPPLNLQREVFTVGGALSRTFSIWSRNLPAFFGSALVLNLPLLLIPAAATQPLATAGYTFLTLGLQGLIGIFLAGAFTFAVVEQLRGRSTSAGRAISMGLARFWSLLGVSFTTGLMVGLASLLCLVPGILLWLRWMLVAPVVVIEGGGGGGGGSRARSEFLTAGHRGGLFGMLLLLGIISALVGGLSAVLIHRPGSFAQRLVVQVLWTSLGASFQAVLNATTYYLLRSEKEGVDVEQLAAVFE
jgi:hypothetical protein